MNFKSIVFLLCSIPIPLYIMPAQTTEQNGISSYPASLRVLGEHTENQHEILRNMYQNAIENLTLFQDKNEIELLEKQIKRLSKSFTPDHTLKLINDLLTKISSLTVQTLSADENNGKHESKRVLTDRILKNIPKEFVPYFHDHFFILAAETAYDLYRQHNDPFSDAFIQTHDSLTTNDSFFEDEPLITMLPISNQPSSKSPLNQPITQVPNRSTINPMRRVPMPPRSPRVTTGRTFPSPSLIQMYDVSNEKKSTSPFSKRTTNHLNEN